MSYWTMCRWMHLALLEKQNLSPPPGNWQRKIAVPKWQRTGRAGTKSLRWRGQWKLDLILGLVKMTLPFTLGIKWIADSSINTFLNSAFEGPSEAEEQITWRLGRARLTYRLTFIRRAVRVCSLSCAGVSVPYLWISSCWMKLRSICNESICTWKNRKQTTVNWWRCPGLTAIFSKMSRVAASNPGVHTGFLSPRRSRSLSHSFWRRSQGDSQKCQRAEVK